MECPACGGPVTMEVGPERLLSASVVETVFAADEDERIELTRNCWECGWAEVRSLSIDSIETSEGDARAVERATLIDDIVSELTAIDSLATLEDALREVRRQRRLDSAASGSTDDSCEE